MIECTLGSVMTLVVGLGQTRKFMHEHHELTSRVPTLDQRWTFAFPAFGGGLGCDPCRHPC